LNIQLLKNEAIVLLDFWNLSEWEFRLGTRCRSLGVCKMREKLIEVQEFHAIHDSAEDVLDTLKHEIAHALAWIRYGTSIAVHGREWQELAKLVGCSPAGCETTAASISHRLAKQPGKYTATCGGCGQTFNWYRKPKRMTGKYCTPCGPDRGSLTIRENI